ncbi:hypothetical protein CEP52_017454 [Fusarium oligoseptatum]|uniref:Chromo domain-containing protein n=1 Tax=Fusarium oligoseptatum TaxID=2604345 RepID=A0A428RR53_9HYPO|nr:hypothetical protein CEP52_017454 [Fusarium oligoseptatum]
MGKAKSVADALRLGSERSAAVESNIVNGELVHRTLQPAVERNYRKMIEFWFEYQRTSSKASFIKGPLAKEMGMPKHKRRRRFATKNVMLNYARQLWAADWIEHKHPATPVDDWGLLLGNTYSSSRIGEYIESTCRGGTGRGLYFKDLTFVAFINEEGAPEFAIQLTRDAKNMTSTPNKRPQHALYEGTEPRVLCFNPMLPFLARLLAYEAFRDYKTIGELLMIVPPEGEMWVVQWKEHLLETPFFRSQSSEDIETAGAFSHRLRSLGLRAGYPTPPRHHDIRAEGLHLMNQFESEATRMVYAGHTDPNTLAMHYLPRNGADGQAAYHGQERRTLVLDLFRSLTIPRNPRLWQCLPAKQQYDCDTSPEMMHINLQILTLRGTTNKKSQEQRKKLYAEKRELIAKRLRRWQKTQPVKHDDSPGYHRAIFDRVRFLMPERDRLAQNLFLIDKLRSSAGLAVLHDMLALYHKRRNVEYRPGLEPDKCHCRKDNDDSPYDWRHIYDCHRIAAEKVDGFAELCFLCNEWFYGIGAWEMHCQHHLDHPDSLPTCVKRKPSPGPSGLSQESTPFCNSGTTDCEDAALSGYSTPLSSAPSEEVIDPAMSLGESWPGDKLTGCTGASGPLESTPNTLQEIQGPLHSSFPAVVSVTEERGVTSTTSFMDTDLSSQDNSTGQVSESTKAGITPYLTSNDEERIGRVPIRNNRGEECHDKPLPLDQEGTEFEVESLVAKGRLGRRVWYKVKWKGYPESDNSWVKKKDIGTGATANYEAKHPGGRGEFKFEALVSKKEIEGVILYEAKWRGQPSSENMWVDKWDVGTKAVLAFEASLST